MKIEKIHLDDITRCYSASHLFIDNDLYVMLASEDPSSVCYSYTNDDFSKKELVWNDRGGCMSIIPFENRKGEFLAVNEFYLKVTPSLSKIVWGKKTDEGWKIKDLFSLPYLHRFDIYSVGDIDYIICATIARNKLNKEDWSEPGQVYVGILDKDLSEPIELKQIVDGSFRNHGYYRSENNGSICGYFSSDQGVIRITPPLSVDGEWKIEKIMDGQIGEIALIDIDNDGKLEIITIEPFHGNVIKIYKLNNDKYECVFTYDNEIDFAHTLIGREINGVPSFIAGIRRMDAELIIIQFIDGNYIVTTIEKGVGPANVDYVQLEDYGLLISANHTANEAAVYKISKE